MRKQIFISSVQKEFREEREFLKHFIETNPILNHFFSVFAFELDAPAADKTTSEVYLEALAHCDIYLGLIGNDYGNEDADGISPTEREYDEATRLGLERLIMVKGGYDAKRKRKEKAFLKKVSGQLTWQAYHTQHDLQDSVFSSLDRLLTESGSYRLGPFDSSICEEAALDDIDEKKVLWFLTTAINERKFSMPRNASVHDVLLKLKLLTSDEKLTNAAILLFGKEPQRFFISSKVKCIAWYSKERIKPIRDYQVFEGNIFDLSDKAVDFVMSKLERHVGTRDHGPQADTPFEIPEKVVAEAINNALAHRNYLSNASIQIEFYTDRIEIFSPGPLNPEVTPEMLRTVHSSFPNNPLLADAMFLVRYIEQVGSGTSDIIDTCKNLNLQEPAFNVTPHSVTTILYRECYVQKSSQETRLKSGQETTGKSGQETAKKSGQETAKKSGQETRLKSGQETTVESGQETTVKSGQENTEKSGQKTAEKSGQKTAEKSGQKTAKKSGQENTKKSGQETAKKSSQEPEKLTDLAHNPKTKYLILHLISHNAFITQTTLTKELGINRSALIRHISNLKQEGYIKRIGPNKGGHWKIIKITP